MKVIPPILLTHNARGIYTCFGGTFALSKREY